MAQEALFETLARHSLFTDTVEEQVSSLEENDLREVVADCYSAIDSSAMRPSSTDIVANARLAGGPSPCEGLECRLRAASQLAQFSALYAPRTWIPNPFDRYLHSLAVTHEKAEPIERANFIGDVFVLYHLRPLISSGLVDFVRAPHYCAEHWKTSGEQHVVRAIEKAAVEIADRFYGKIRVYVQKFDDRYYVETIGPEDLLPGGHRGSFYGGVPEHIASAAANGNKVELKPEDVEGGLFLPLAALAEVSDLHIQSYQARHAGCASLVDRNLDALVLNSLGAERRVDRSRALLEGFSHVLPTVQEASIQQLVTLRHEEADAFGVYQESVRRALGAVASDLDARAESAKIRDVFQQVVAPELKRIDKAVHDFRRAALGRSLKSAALAAASITVGLFSGLPGALGHAIAAFGATQGLYDSGKDGLQAIGEPEVARANDFYFLWRARKLTA